MTDGRDSGDRATAPQKKRFSLLAKVISAAIGVIGAVTGVVSILPIVLRDASSVDSLVATVEPIESPLTHLFALPANADWESFPTSVEGCDTDQFDWLAERGTELHERYLLEVANSAKEGAMIALKDFRGEGEVSAAGEQLISVLCDQSGVTSQLRAASLDPASGEPARYVQNNPNVPDNPLVYTLEPGETGQIALSLRSAFDFSGEVVVTVALGTEKKDVVLPFGDTLTVAGVSQDPARFTVRGGVLSCIADEECVVEDVIARIAQ
jgi:hypothetical protein